MSDGMSSWKATMEALASQAVAYAAAARNSTRLRQLAWVAIGTNILLAVLFTALVIVMGPGTASFTMGLAGHDAHERLDGEPTVQSSTVASPLGLYLERQSSLLRNPEGDINRATEIGGSLELERAATRQTVAMIAMGNATRQSPEGITPRERFYRAGVTCPTKTGSESVGDTSLAGNEQPATERIPVEIVGSYHYGIDKQYAQSNKGLLNVVDSDQFDSSLRLWQLENIDPRTDDPVYNRVADYQTLSPHIPDFYKINHFVVRDVLSDKKNRDVLRNESYTEIGAYYQMANDRTVYYTVVVC